MATPRGIGGAGRTRSGPALGGGYAHAFELSVALLAGLLIVLAVLTSLLPPHRRVERPAEDV